MIHLLSPDASAIPPSIPVAILAVMYGLPFSILEKNPLLSDLASFLKRPSIISISIACFENPFCELSSDATYTFLIPCFLIASAQGGVLPVVEHGSSVTNISEFSSADFACSPKLSKTS